ncbi:MAG: phage antirepressor KilAC domain-containing protein [Akkermansia sp.]|nr:phage antirepressor KilAC domain-containing protein [Akkermansia sp.]
MKEERVYTVTELADALCKQGMDVTDAEVFSWLRLRGYMLSGLVDTWNAPSDPSLELDYLTEDRTSSMNPDGSVTIHRETLLTQRGWDVLLPRIARDMRGRKEDRA